MKSWFYELADDVCGLGEKNERIVCRFQAEESDFVRLNQAKIRQAGNVFQASLTVTLVDGNRHVRSVLGLAKNASIDKATVRTAVADLREKIAHIPEDPYILYAETPASSESMGENTLPETGETVWKIIESAGSADLVGIYAAGGMFFGFANSLGQRNWFERHSFNFDWSLYHKKDKAVKSNYAGFRWDDSEFGEKMASAADRLEILRKPSATVPPGKYRVFLSPTALYDFVEMLGFTGFGLRNHRSKTTSLIKMVEENKTLHPSVSMSEDTVGGIAPNFTAEGFIKPDRVELVGNGMYKNCLVSPRSGKEYDVGHTAANRGEAPESFEMSAGEIPEDDVLEALGNGIWINNVWYLNFSDVSACRMTGMTRFACFLVKNGEIAAPLDVMRFDESIYRMLGENLIGLTRERDFILSERTYMARSTDSSRLPGALIEDFRLTL